MLVSSSSSLEGDLPSATRLQFVPFSKLGVRLSYFDEFIAGTSHEIGSKSTKEVCDVIVKPATLSAESSFCDMLVNQPCLS